MKNSRIKDGLAAGLPRSLHSPARGGRGIVLGCAIGMMLGLLAASGAHAQAGSTPPAAPTPQLGPMTQDQLEMAARFGECGRKVQEERTAGLITALRLGAAAVEVEVDRAKWGPLPFQAKLAVVQTVSCYVVAGNPKLQARVQVLDGRNHQKLGYYDGSKLKYP